jgi:anti-sigma factor RsiW
MRCERARDLISPYLDDELGGRDRAAVATHLGACAGCARLALDLRRVAESIAKGGRRRVPTTLLARLRANLAAAQRVEGQAPRSQRFPALAGMAWRASLVLAACALTACATWWLRGMAEGSTRLEHDVLAAHIRSLLQESPIAVAAADAHVVKPWFSGRLDFSPRVEDLSAAGFQLLGGRLDYVGDRRVGVLVYKRHLNTINVFVWPHGSGEARLPLLVSRQGYNLLTWTHRGLSYWAISDLSGGELRQILSLL